MLFEIMIYISYKNEKKSEKYHNFVCFEIDI